MTIAKSRIKVEAIGSGVGSNLLLGAPLESFVSFPDGTHSYIILASSGEWQIGVGVVSGSYLTRGTVEENHLGTTDQIDFTSKEIQIAEVITATYLNNITNKLDTIEASAKDDQIASEVPFTPAGSIPNANVQAALENVDSRLDSHSQAASSIVYDPVDDPITAAVTIQNAVKEHGISLGNRAVARTGIIFGGEITGTVGNTVIDIASGKGVIVNNYSDPENPTFISQLWDAFSAVDISPEAGSVTATDIHIFIWSDAGTADIVKYVGTPPTSYFRDYIFLGRVHTFNGVIKAIVASPSVTKQTSTDLSDLLYKASGIEGGEVHGVTGNLGLYQSPGTFFYPGINYYGTAYKTPNKLDFLISASPLSFDTLDQLDAIISTGLVITPLLYDAGGSVLALPTGKSTIHRLYSLGFKNGQRYFVLQYGQELYDSSDDAKTNIALDVFVKAYSASNMSLIAYVCVSETSTNFEETNLSWILSTGIEASSADTHGFLKTDGSNNMSNYLNLIKNDATEISIKFRNTIAGVATGISSIGELYLAQTNTSGVWVKNYIKGIIDAGVQLFFNGIKRLETTNTGIDVTGVTITDGISSDGPIIVNADSTSSLQINKSSVNQYSGIDFRTVGVEHWLLYTKNAANGDFAMQSRNYDTDGSFKESIFSVSWSNGIVAFNKAPQSLVDPAADNDLIRRKFYEDTNWADVLNNNYSILYSNEDLNLLLTGGEYRGVTMTNAPSSAWWYISNKVYGTTYVLQTVTSLTLIDIEMHSRCQVNGVWQPWVKHALANKSTTFEAPQLIDALIEYSTASVTPNLDTVSAIYISFAGAVTINNPVFTGSWGRAIRSGIIHMPAAVTSIAFGTAWRFGNGTPPPGNEAGYILFTAYGVNDIPCLYIKRD